MPLSKSDLVKKVAEKSGKHAKDVQTIADTLLDIIRETLVSGDSVRLIGFGAFSTAISAEREAISPRTKEKVHVPAKRRVKFTPGKELSEAVDTSK